MNDAVEWIAHEGWGEVVMNRPEVKNAINGPLGEGLAAALNQANDDPGINVVVLRGAGGAFCSGLDLKAFNAEPEPEWLSRFNLIWRGAHRALFECQKPIIGALERYAINGGAALALAADLLIAGDSAYVQVGEVKLGMAAPYNMAWLRLRHSENVAARMTISGRRFSGRELADLGVAYESVADADVVERACALAAEIAAYPPGAAAKIKSMMRIYNVDSIDDWFDQATTQSGPRVKPSAVKD